MCKISKVSFSKSWGFMIPLQLLLCSPQVSLGKNINPEGDMLIIQLEQRPMDLPAQVTHLEELIELALSRNSGIKARYAEWRSDQEAAKTITGLPDPTLGIGYFIEPIETAQGPQAAKISLGQSIPWFSKTRAAREASLYQAIQSFDGLKEEQLSLIRQINNIWSEAAHLRSITTIITAKLALSIDLEEVSRIQYQSGSFSHQRLMEVQTQTLQMENDLLDIESQYYRLRVKLASILELDAPVAENFLPSSIKNFEVDTSSMQVSADHPRLQSLQAMVQEAQSIKAGARAAYVPNLNIGVDYILTDKKITGGVEVDGSGKDPLVVSAGIALPIWNWKSKKAAVNASEWREKKAQAMLMAENTRLTRENEIARSRLEEDLRLIQLYEEQLIPKAMEIENVMQQEYIGQSSDLFSYTMARLHVLDLQLALSKRQYSAQLHLADLRYLKGN